MDNGGNVTPINGNPSAPGTAQAAPARRGPTRVELLRRRQAERDGDIDFPLTATADGWVAKVKRPSLADRTAMGAMPTAIQNRIIAQLNANRKNDAGDAPGSALTIQRQMRNAGNNEALANAMSLAAFVSPRLTEEATEVNEEADIYHVEDIHLNDRLALMQWCLGNDETAGGRIEPFRYVPDGPLVRVAAPASDGGAAQ